VPKKSYGPYDEKPIPVRLSTQLIARIDALAHEMQENRSTVIRFAIRFGLPVVERALAKGEELDPPTKDERFIIEEDKNGDGPKGKK